MASVQEPAPKSAKKHKDKKEKREKKRKASEADDEQPPSKKQRRQDGQAPAAPGTNGAHANDGTAAAEASSVERSFGGKPLQLTVPQPPLLDLSGVIAGRQELWVVQVPMLFDVETLAGRQLSLVEGDLDSVDVVGRLAIDQAVADDMLMASHLALQLEASAMRDELCVITPNSTDDRQLRMLLPTRRLALVEDLEAEEAELFESMNWGAPRQLQEPADEVAGFDMQEDGPNGGSDREADGQATAVGISGQRQQQQQQRQGQQQGQDGRKGSDVKEQKKHKKEKKDKKVHKEKKHKKDKKPRDGVGSDD